MVRRDSVGPIEIRARIYLDGAEVGRLGAGMSTAITTTPGMHRLRCRLWVFQSNELTVELRESTSLSVLLTTALKLKVPLLERIALHLQGRTLALIAVEAP